MLELHYIVTVLYISLTLFSIHITAALLMQERKYPVKKTALLWTLGGIIFLLDIYFCYALLPESLRLPVSVTIGFLFYAGIFIYTSADGLWKKCYLLITYECVGIILWSAGIYLCYLIVPNSSDNIKLFIRSLIHISISLPLLLAYRKYFRPLIREVSGFQKRNWKTLSIVSAIYFWILVVVMSKIKAENQINTDTLFVFVIVMCTFIAVSIISVSNIYHMRKEAKSELIKQNIEYLMSYVENAGKAEQENRRIRHDKRHHDACIAAMAQAGNTKGILRYLGQEEEKTQPYPTWCPHIMVNEILNSYAKKAKDAGVKYTAQSDTPAQSPVADVDFVAILANLLENALNACIKIDSPGPMQIHMKNIDKKTVIAVSNPCSTDLKLENGLPADRSIGIDSIVSSAARYHGEVSYKMQDGICTACVILNP